MSEDMIPQTRVLALINAGEGPPEWLEKAYALNAADKPSAASEVLVDNIDMLLLSGEVQECDNILAALDVDRLLAQPILGVLSAVGDRQDMLPCWPAVIERARTRLTVLDRPELVAKVCPNGSLRESTTASPCA